MPKVNKNNKSTITKESKRNIKTVENDKSKENFKPIRFKELLGLLFVFVGIILLFSITNPSISGNFGETINEALNGTLGIASFTVPFLILLIGARFYFPFKIKALIYFSIPVLIVVWMAEISRCIWFSGKGIAGLYVGNFLTEKIGSIITAILFVFILIACLIIFARVSIIKHSEKMVEKLKEKHRELKEAQEAAKIAKQESEEAEREKEDLNNSDNSDDEEVTEELQPIEPEQEIQTEEPITIEEQIEITPQLQPIEEEDNSEYYREHQDEILDDFLDSKEPCSVSSYEDYSDSVIEPEDLDKSLDEELLQQEPAAPVKSQPKPVFSSNLNDDDKPKADLVMVSQNYKYKLPPLSILANPTPIQHKTPPKDYSQKLIETLDSFGVSAKVCHIQRGPSVTRYELELGKGVKVSKITGLTNDISLIFAAPVRIAPVPGKSYLGIEVPNDQIDMVSLKEILASEEFRKSSWHIPVALGKDITGKTIVGDLAKMPHLLVAGSTGSGKSVCMNCLIASILYRAKPTEVQMVMVDPKKVELSVYEGIPHLVDIKATPDKKIITDPKIAALVLAQMTEIMDNRYNEFQRSHVRNIFEYNEKSAVTLPYLLIFIDELADLMMISKGGVEQSICRLTQLGRAAGVHLIIATQRPSVDVITGLIKVNVPSRIAFAVASQVDSRTILDSMGAEKLLGKGDMLYLPGGAADSKRVQGAFVDTDEIEKLVSFWQEQPPPENMQPIDIVAPSEANSPDDSQDSEEGLDELYDEALKIILQERFASVSILQRKMKIGYARAGRIVDQMEKKGVVGPANGSKPRKILVGALAGDHYLNSI